MYTIDNASMCQEASNVLFDGDTDISIPWNGQHATYMGPSGCSKYKWDDHAKFNPLDPNSDNGYGVYGCNRSSYPCICASFPVSFFVLTVLAS